MKYLLLFIFIFSLIGSVSAQDIEGFVNDGAGILTVEEKAQISSVLNQLYRSDIAQIAIVTVSSLEGGSIEALALEMAEGNLGTKEKDNGLLLLIAVEDKQYRFEVGRGLEPIFNDAKVGRYGREFLVPAFQQEQYGVGVLLVLNEITKELTGEEISDVPVGFARQGIPLNAWFQLIVPFLFLMSFISAIIGKKKGKESNRYFWGAVIAAQMLRGGQGGSGGFGGFGGGGFSGGGASGGW